MSLPKETQIAIASLCGKLRYIAGRMREYSVANVLDVMTAIYQAFAVSKQLPDTSLVQDVQAALSLVWKALGQPDTPTEWAILDKKPYKDVDVLPVALWPEYLKLEAKLPRSAVRKCPQGTYLLYRAWERGRGNLLEDLADKLDACVGRGFPEADAIHAGNDFTPLACDWNILEYLAKRDAREKTENIAVRGAGTTLLKKRLRALERAGWIDRKEGKRSGYAITPLGREKLRDRNATVTRP